MKYLSILFLVVFFGCKKDASITNPIKFTSKPADVCGCTDSAALNYNSLANKDNSSCKYKYEDILGTWRIIYIEHDIIDDPPTGYHSDTYHSDSFDIVISKYDKDRVKINSSYYYYSGNGYFTFNGLTINKGKIEYHTYSDRSACTTEYIKEATGTGIRIK